MVSSYYSSVFHSNKCVTINSSLSAKFFMLNESSGNDPRGTTIGNRLDKSIVRNNGREIQMEDGLILVAMLVGLFLLTRKGEKPQEVKITSPGKRTQ